MPNKKTTKVVATIEEEIREPTPPKKKQDTTTTPSAPIKKSPIIDSMKPLFKSTILKFIREDTDIQEAIVSLIKRNPRRKSATIKPTEQPPPPPPPPCPYIPPTTSKNPILDYLKLNITHVIQYEDFVELSVVEIEDLEYILEHGFIEGFVQLIKKNLDQLEFKTRPIQSFRRDYTAVYIKTGPKSWKKDSVKLENLAEIVFGFSQKVDIKISEVYSDTDKLYVARRHASGGIDRIQHIEEICQRIADYCYVELD